MKINLFWTFDRTFMLTKKHFYFYKESCFIVLFTCYIPLNLQQKSSMKFFDCIRVKSEIFLGFFDET